MDFGPTLSDASLAVRTPAYGASSAASVLSSGEGKGRLQDQVQRAMGWFRELVTAG